MSEIFKRFDEILEEKKPADKSGEAQKQTQEDRADYNRQEQQKQSDYRDAGRTSNAPRGETISGFFGRVELIEQTVDGAITHIKSCPATIQQEAMRDLIANAPDAGDRRIFKPELPITALRELDQIFPELHSTDNRIILGTGDIFDHMRETCEHRDANIIDKFSWFRSKVNTNQEWDFKSFYKEPTTHDELLQHNIRQRIVAPSWVQDYGNFHYGAMAFAAGIPKDQALVFAGAAQQGGTERYGVNTMLGIISGIKNTAKAALLPYNGDADMNDQFRVWQGWRWAEKHAQEIGRVK
jgi:hypothetical protein